MRDLHQPDTALSMRPTGLLANPVVQKLSSLVRLGINGLNLLQPVATLGARLYVAQAFFASGLTKLHNWDTTLALFKDEYLSLIHI